MMTVNCLRMRKWTAFFLMILIAQLHASDQQMSEWERLQFQEVEIEVKNESLKDSSFQTQRPEFSQESLVKRRENFHEQMLHDAVMSP